MNSCKVSYDQTSSFSASPMLSVVMPVYNAGERLHKAITCVLNQTYQNFELILVDDGSTDGSEIVCDEYAARDNRVIVKHVANGGVSSARNFGISVSNGKYIAFIDADDIIAPDAYKKCIDQLTNSDAELVIFGMHFDYYMKGELKNSRIFTAGDFELGISNSLDSHFFELYNANYLTPVWNKVYASALIKRNDIKFNTNMAILEDFAFVLDFLCAASNIIVLSDAFYHYYNDLDTSSFRRRPNIDYLKNFHSLGSKLHTLSQRIGLISTHEYGRIQAILFRSYLIGVERIVNQRTGLRIRHKDLVLYIQDTYFQAVTNEARCTSVQLKIICWLVKRNQALFLLMLLWVRQIGVRFLRRMK